MKDPEMLGVLMPLGDHAGIQGGRRGSCCCTCPQRGLSPGAARTSEKLEVGKGLREDTAALLLHGQRDHHEAVGQLGEVLDEVILPAERKRRLQSNDAGHGRAGGLSRPSGRGTDGSGGQGTSPASRRPNRGWGLQPPPPATPALQPSEVMLNELPGDCGSVSSPAAGDRSQPGDPATGFGPDFQSVPLERGQTAARREEWLLHPKVAPFHRLQHLPSMGP